ncbi:hypothetical protein T440DRAFT_60631 [Plenodomus tracheiphilus IPT5]|uniref:Uncharacterized protein n=1 Tax=Plenodomus tracheiphilus IPT5 TaxID=1408161 RepID=A0A6A7ALQ8_9PLEO|nr:hypothetical protein T440DRAFT_60631 [Plenodomus tracheiphilus IPT5]
MEREGPSMGCKHLAYGDCTANEGSHRRTRMHYRYPVTSIARKREMPLSEMIPLQSKSILTTSTDELAACALLFFGSFSVALHLVMIKIRWSWSQRQPMSHAA